MPLPTGAFLLDFPLLGPRSHLVFAEAASLEDIFIGHNSIVFDARDHPCADLHGENECAAPAGDLIFWYWHPDIFKELQDPAFHSSIRVTPIEFINIALS